MQQPRLMPDLPMAKSVTDDDESHEEPVPRYSVPNQNGTQDVDPRALAYLLRYETMMRQQEAEEMATLAHVRPLLERIQSLGSESEDEVAYSTDESRLMESEVKYTVLQRALDKLEASSEVMTTDKQLMMVLRTLAEKATTAEETITLAEFLQCYKTVVTGMQTLQHLPGESHVRSRARDRTLSILSLFEPPSTKLFNEVSHSGVNAKDGVSTRSARAPEGKRAKYRRLVRLTLFSAALLLVASLWIAFFAPQSLHDTLRKYVGYLPTPPSVPSLGSPPRSGWNRPKAQVVSRASRNTPAVEPSRSNDSRLDRAFKSTKGDELERVTMGTVLKQNPSFGKEVKNRMIGSALAGGAAGALLAPTAWNTIRVASSKLLSGIASVVPGTNPVVALGVALAAGTAALFHGNGRNSRVLLGPFGDDTKRNH